MENILPVREAEDVSNKDIKRATLLFSDELDSELWSCWSCSILSVTLTEVTYVGYSFHFTDKITQQTSAEIRSTGVEQHFLRA